MNPKKVRYRFDKDWWQNCAETFYPILRVLICALIVVAAACHIGVTAGGDGTLRDMKDSKFHVGDVWEYEARSGDERSRLTIVKVEQSDKLGVIVHIGVDKLIWKACGQHGVPEAVPHMPFALKALDSSVTRQVGAHETLPNYQEGYEIWREGFLKGKAGIYTILVKDAVSVAEATWRSGVGCDKESN